MEPSDAESSSYVDSDYSSGDSSVLSSSLTTSPASGLLHRSNPIYLELPLILSEQSAKSRVYEDYLRAARKMIADGLDLTQVLGVEDEVVVDLFFRKRQLGDNFDCSSWASEVCRSYREMDRCTGLASVFLLTLMMRWLLLPTELRYGRLPDMIRPTLYQRQVPHVGAIELIPFPAIRDTLITQSPSRLLPLKRSTWSVNWPFPISHALHQDHATGTTRLSKQFMAHASNGLNWSVGASFVKDFPELDGRIRIRQCHRSEMGDNRPMNLRK